jgi:hypothetical protein
MKCWFRRAKGGDWAQGSVVGYAGSPPVAIVKVDRHGEAVNVPIAQLSLGDNKPAEGDDFYRDGRDQADSFTQNVTRPAPEGINK